MVDMKGGNQGTVVMNEKVIHLIYKFFWIITILLVFFHDRQDTFQKVIAIFFLILMTVLLCFRVLESKKSWKKYLDNEDDLS